MNAPAADTVAIRSCAADDFDVTVPLLRRLYANKTFYLAAPRSADKSSLDSDQRMLRCAVCDGPTVGFGSVTIKTNLLWCETRIGYISDLVVDELYRGLRILNRHVSRARGQGCNRIVLNSEFHRKKAHAFYEHRGFTRGAYFYSKTP